MASLDLYCEGASTDMQLGPVGLHQGHDLT